MVSGKDETPVLDRKLKMGMVGGGRGAFIGGVHRRAAALDGSVELVAGALSSSPEKAVASAKDLYITDERAYPSWEAMLERESELPEGDRVDSDAQSHAFPSGQGICGSWFQCGV
jgi:predicted dehydrogenase